MEYLDFETYSRKARAECHKVYKNVPKGLEIDHIMSIKDCFEKGVPVDVVSHPANLQLLDRDENRDKGARSDIGKFELINRIREHRLTGADKKGAVERE